MAKKTDSGAAFRDFKAALRQKQPHHLYIFHGEEDYLRTYYLAALKKLLLDGPAEDFNLHRFDARTWDLSAFSDAVDAIPVMAEASFIQVDDVDIYQLPAEDREQLAALLGDIPDYCYIVFLYDTVPWKPDRRQRKFHAAIEQNARVVAFDRQPERELMSWVARHFASLGKTVTPELCRYLIAICGASMTAMAAEISKIAAYCTADAISRADIDAVVEPVLDAVVFELTDAVAAGRYDKALKTLNTLLQMQQEPIPILGAIGSQLRRASAAQILASNGRGPDALMRMYGLSSYPAQKAFDFARRVPERFFETALSLCAETDWQMKTSFDTPEALLELLVLRLAQEAKNG